MKSIRDENIWISGGGSGIGRALAQQLARNGNFVIISGRNSESLEETRQFDPKRIKVITCDVSDIDSMRSLTTEVLNYTDSLDRVFLSAGTCEYLDNVEPIDTEIFKRIFSVNLYGLINSINFALPFLKKAQRRGHILAISSMVTQAPFPRAEAYGASKAAVDYLINSLRIDMAGLKIDVSNVSPGFVDTPLTSTNDFPMPFLMTADDAARIILREAAIRRKNIMFPKRLKWMLMLHKLFPGLWTKLMINRMQERIAL